VLKINAKWLRYANYLPEGGHWR